MEEEASEFAYLRAMCADRDVVSEGDGERAGTRAEKVIREDGGSSCNGLRRQASRLMEPCSSRKALSIRAARASMLSGLRHSKSAASPRWLFPCAQVRGTGESADLKYFSFLKRYCTAYRLPALS